MPSNTTPHLEIVAAKDGDRATISNLIQLYLYDMASTAPFPVGEDGRYEYTMLDNFWQHPYLLKADGDLAGFALIVDHCPITQTSPCWFMAEFFVLRPYRRKSIGAAAFAKIKSRHAGRWHIATVTENRKGEAFWSAVIPDTTCEKLDARFDGMNWVVRSFETER